MWVGMFNNELLMYVTEEATNILKDNYRCTNRLITERLSDGEISVDRYPHEGVDRDAPEGHFDVTGQSAHQVTEHPSPGYCGVYG